VTRLGELGVEPDQLDRVVAAILEHPGIEVRLSTALRRSDPYDHVVWTGPIDAYFEFEHGHLGYRTLDFQREVHDGDFQGCPVMNYCDPDVPYTRITEHKHFAPWEDHERTVTYTEFSRTAEPDDIPYYPVRLVREKAQLLEYVGLARRAPNVTFVGRLGTYRYLDMDVTIKEALDAATVVRDGLVSGEPIPAFVVDPLA
jgi:UDP-galactopyranose mutase